MIKKLSLLVSLALLPFAPLSAKSKADFSEFKGTYTGSTSLTANFGSIVTLGGPASIRVAVPRNGRSAVATISGSLTSGSTTAPIFGTLTMTKSALSGSDALFNLSPTAPFTVPGSLSKNGFTASGSTSIVSTPVVIQSSVKVKPQGKKKKRIIITYVISASGASYSFQFTATGKVRKN